MMPSSREKLLSIYGLMLMMNIFLFLYVLSSVLGDLSPEYNERYATMGSDNYTEGLGSDFNVLVDKTSITTIQKMSFDDLTEEQKIEVLERLKASDVFSSHDIEISLNRSPLNMPFDGLNDSEHLFDASPVYNSASPLTIPVHNLNDFETAEYQNNISSIDHSSSSSGTSFQSSTTTEYQNDASFSENNSSLESISSHSSNGIQFLESRNNLSSFDISSSTETHFFHCSNVTETPEYQNLTVQFDTLQHEYQIKKDFIHQLQEKYETTQRNHSISEVQYKLLVNELNMNKLIQEQAKLKFEELSLRYEEKISFYQKEVNRLGSQLKESQRKNVVATKLDCSTYCSQHFQQPLNTTRSGINVEGPNDNDNDGSFSPRVSPFRNFFLSMSSKLKSSVNGVESKGDLNYSVEGKNDRSRISLLYPGVQTLLDEFLAMSIPQCVCSLPLYLVGFIYYEYSFFYYLLFQYFPLNYPDIVDYVLSPIWQLFYHRLGIAFVLLSLRSFYYSLYDNDIMADVLNDISWKLYHFVQFLENEDNTSTDYFLMLLENINSDYILNNSFVNSAFSFLSPEGQQWIKNYLLVVCISLIGIFILQKTYRLIFGVFLVILVISVAPWLLLLSIPLNIFILLLAVIERVYSFLFSTKKVNNATTPTEPTKRRKIRRVHGHNRHFQHSDITHLPPPDQII
jgi:hypothetical protein